MQVWGSRPGEKSRRPWWRARKQPVGRRLGKEVGEGRRWGEGRGWGERETWVWGHKPTHCSFSRAKHKGTISEIWSIRGG